ncbi:MAG: hypothetical protein HUU16_03225 [Candidatus Omnitrophica bacterium]|nr:hypothetical protein [Candidatus Omnitrophota bacterium]
MTKPLAGIQWALVLGIAPALFGALSAPAQVSPETRARLLREFEEKNRSKHTEKSTDSERPKADPNVGLEELRGNLSKARTRLLSDRSKEAKEDAARAALLYADSLLRLGRTEEAISVLTTTLAQGADEDRIIPFLVEARTSVAEDALDNGEWEKARVALDKAWREARLSRDSDLVGACARNLRDLMEDRALELFRKGDLSGSKEKAIEALSWRLEPEPIHLLLSRIAHLKDNHEEALAEIRAAARGAADRHALGAIRDIIERERDLERGYDRAELKGAIVLSPRGLAYDRQGLERALLSARETAKRMFGFETLLPVRLSLYQRNDFRVFTSAPTWAGAASILGKLRLRNDLARGRIQDMEVTIRYGFGLWMADIAAEGKAPAWLQEGIAHQLAYPLGPPNGGKGEIRKRLNNGSLPSFRSLEESFLGFPDMLEAATAMVQSQWGMQFLVEKRGLGVILSLLVALREGLSPEQALREVAGFDYDALDREWSEGTLRGFTTNPDPDRSTLRSLGLISPMGSYWEQ